MNAKDLDMIKSVLEEQLEGLLESAKGTITRISHQERLYSDPVDRASYDEEQSRLLRFRDRESTLIKKIRSALKQIEDETYGICETCGDEISIKRLYARPVTTKCIACKTQEESIEKMFG